LQRPLSLKLLQAAEAMRRERNKPDWPGRISWSAVNAGEAGLCQ
jgi:hypothetical protein